MTRWTAIPAARSSAPVLKARLYAVLGLLGFAAVAGVLSLGITLFRGSSKAPTVAAVVALPQGQAEAEVVAREWLAGEPITVPVAIGLETLTKTFEASTPRKPLGQSERLSWSSFTTQRDGGRDVEVHRFLLDPTAPGGQTRILTVVIQLTFQGRVLVAAPSLEPFGTPQNLPQRFDWAEFSRRPKTVQLTRAVQTWVDAYLGDQRENLQSLTGDPKLRQYAGLGGFSASQADVKILSVVARVDQPELSVVRVEVNATATDGWSDAMEYDLLVGDVGSIPKILSWGPPGTGGLLVPYQNALTSGE